MQNSSPLGVLIVGQQNSAMAQHDFDQLVSSVSHGDIKGVVFEDQISLDGRHASLVHPHTVRKGAVWGAGVGLVLGLAPMITSILVAAGAGALVAKASEIRLEGGSAPRLHFAKRDTSEQTDSNFN